MSEESAPRKLTDVELQRFESAREKLPVHGRLCSFSMTVNGPKVSMSLTSFQTIADELALRAAEEERLKQVVFGYEKSLAIIKAVVE